jgi:hypothetical protein
VAKTQFIFIAIYPIKLEEEAGYQNGLIYKKGAYFNAAMVEVNALRYFLNSGYGLFTPPRVNPPTLALQILKLRLIA